MSFLKTFHSITKKEDIIKKMFIVMTLFSKQLQFFFMLQH